MTALDAEHPSSPDGSDPPSGRSLAYLIVSGLALLFIVTVAVAITSLGVDDEDAGATTTPATTTVKRDLPAHWTVRRGDTYNRIADRTGLSVEELQTLNPYVDPAAIQPGQRLKLREDAAKTRTETRPRGPKWVTVREGDSFGSIAVKTGKSFARLQQLNPGLEGSKLQPGDRVRLR